MIAGEELETRRREVAVRIALKTGLLKRCPTHGEIYDPGRHDYQGTCMVATFMINNADPMVAEFQGDRAPLTELLKTICSGYSPCCSQCDSPATG